MSSHVVAAVVHAVPALVWGVMAVDAWRYLLWNGTRSGLFRLLPLVMTFNAVHYGAHVLIEITPTEIGGRAPWLHPLLLTLIQVCTVGAIAVMRHLVPLVPLREEPPSRAWLAVNYGIAALAAAIVLLPLLAPGFAEVHSWPRSAAVAGGYAIVVSAISLYELSRLVARGAWRTGAYDLRSPDVIVFTVVLFGVVVMLLVLPTRPSAVSAGSASGLFFHTAVGLGMAVPFAVRMLGELIRGLLLSAAMVIALGLTLAAYGAASGGGGSEGHALAMVVGVSLLLVVLGPGYRALAVLTDRLVFRRSQRRREELQVEAAALSAELGTRDCCRRVVEALVRVLRMPSVAVVLDGDDGVGTGVFRLDRLREAWAGVRLERRGVVFVRELPPALLEATRDTEIMWVVPIVSPRTYRGHLFLAPGLVRGELTREDALAVTALVGQLALVLDAADLLERAITVERSLAHAEKLAAIGETAARIAHEIRNPVTAARSLAQQLAREQSPFHEEHALILAELERVERQVAALLRFARKEEFALVPVDLAMLVRGTLDAYRTRLATAGIALAVDASDGVVARVDGEKLRQVLVNLLDNACDALAEAPGPRALAVTVGQSNGSATVGVSDTGPGVPAAALPRLFEPFFSLKAHGTGLGLAIARRTVEGHGGRLEAVTGPGGGMTFRIALPLAAPHLP